MIEPGTTEPVTRHPPVPCSRRAFTDRLLLAAGRGDLDAFAAFYDATAPAVLGLVHRALDRPERTERLVEQVYLVLWRAAAAFDPAVRSADATVLAVARRVLVTPVRAATATAGARRPARRPRP